MHLCGDFGFVTKAGTPCGYRLAAGKKCCPHHAEDKSFAKSFQMKGVYSREDMRLPNAIVTNDFENTGDLKRTLSRIADEIATNKHVDLKRMDSLTRVCGVAGTVLNTEAVRELNETIMRAEGHGPALIVLENLKSGRLRKLPGPPAQEVRHAPQ